MLVSLSALSNVFFEVWCLIRVGRDRRWKRHDGSWSVNDSSYPVLLLPADLGGA